LSTLSHRDVMPTWLLRACSLWDGHACKYHWSWCLHPMPSWVVPERNRCHGMRGLPRWWILPSRVGCSEALSGRLIWQSDRHAVAVWVPKLSSRERLLARIRVSNALFRWDGDARRRSARMWPLLSWAVSVWGGSDQLRRMSSGWLLCGGCVCTSPVQSWALRR